MTEKDKTGQKIARLKLGGPQCWKCKYFSRDLSLNYDVKELKEKGLGHCLFNPPRTVETPAKTFSRSEAYMAIRPLVKESEFCSEFVLNVDAEY